MQTRLAPQFADTALGQEAESLLRQCSHCGLCLPACPTYRATGNELDGPRGRIYLVKQLLESGSAGRDTQRHLDRCLGCRACETACPSGVRYHRLADIGRHLLEPANLRSPFDRLRRRMLLRLLRNRPLFGLAVQLGKLARPFFPLPTAGLPSRPRRQRLPAFEEKERWLLLEGCVQPALAPSINDAARRVLAACGVAVEPVRGCCGALAWHLNAADAARNDMRQLVDACVAGLDAGATGILFSASGCGSSVAEYGNLLADDPAWAAKATRVAGAAADLSQVVLDRVERLLPRLQAPDNRRLALHVPCSLQHGLRGGEQLAVLLTRLGYLLLPVSDGDQCCGSAGSYSLLQPRLAQTLRQNKLRALMAGQPPLVATANVGCQCHLQAATDIPVRHWVEILAERLAPADGAA